MEELGVPTISYVTEPFEGLGIATAKGKRIPDLPMVVLNKGYDQRSEEEIREDIRQRAPEILAALTKKGPG